MPELFKVKTINVDPSILNRYLGTYQTDNYMILITKSSDTLFAQIGKNMDKLRPKTKLLPYEENKFWLDNKKARFEFNANQEAQVQTITMYYNETSDIAKKIK